MKTDRMKKGSLRVWHIPQVPMKPFHFTVNSIEEAKKILNVLSDYDNFEFKNKVKPDYSNAQGLEIFEDKEWCEYSSVDGEDISDIMREDRQ